MKKILGSPIVIVISAILFLVCSYWVYKNISLEDLIGDTAVVENVSEAKVSVEK